MKIKKIVYVSLILLTMFLPVGVKAGEEKHIQKLQGSSIVIGAAVNVVDPFIANQNQGLVLFNPGMYQRNLFTKVSFIYGRENKTDIGTAATWAFTITYKLEFFDVNYSKILPDLTGNTLSISFGPNNNPCYEAAQLFKQTGANYYNVKLTITDIAPAPSSSVVIPSDVRLELSMVDQFAFALPKAPVCVVGNNNNNIFWSYCKGAEYYQLEYVYIDANDTYSITTPDQAFSHKEPVRVSTSNQYFAINNTYPNGKIYYRVRGVGNFINTGSTTEKYSNWIYPISPYTAYISNANSFESNKNWQHVTTYAEDAKYKKVISYYDGSLRNRQVQTNISTDTTILVGETKYDFEGRGVVNILPVPVPPVDSALNFKKRFNTFDLDKKAYDDAFVNSNVGNAPLSALSKAAVYYSAGNNLEKNNRNLIPNANGYPFAVTQYMEDGTGRIWRQSTVGDTFRLKDPDYKSRYTEYVYGTPNATELQRLFGSNVGNIKHYKKNLIIDPNGQISVSYLDQESRVIATALAGSLPENLDSLSSNKVVPMYVNLDGANIVDSTNYISTSISRITNVVRNTRYTLSYSMNGVINQATGFMSTCKACTYDLSIVVANPDGIPIKTITRTAISPSSVSCSTNVYNAGNIVSDTITLPKIGQYTITKQLTLNSGAISLLLTTLKGSPGFPDSLSFVTNAIAAIDTSVCDVTCQDHCLTKIFKDHSTWAGNKTFYADSINAALQYCLANGPCADSVNLQNNCTSILKQMQAQLSPGGYYYTNSMEMQAALNKSGQWYDNNNATMSQPSITDLMDITKFNNPAINVKNIWGKNLVRGHKEYCHYNYCVAETRSNNFDLKMALATDWADASARGYLNPVGIDPYFSTVGGIAPLGGSVLSNINSGLANYFSNNGLSSYIESTPDSDPNTVPDTPYDPNSQPGDLWDFANSWIPYNQGTGYTPNSTEKWRLFRTLYQGLKVHQMVWVRENSVPAPNNCPYLGTANAVVLKPELPTDLTTIQTQNANTIAQQCSTGCIQNVKTWMHQLNNNCGVLKNADSISVYFMSKTDSTTVHNQLLSYCNSSCSISNPFGLLLQTDINSPALSQVKTILQSYGCSIAPIVSTNPYINSCDDKVKVQIWNLYPTCLIHVYKCDHTSYRFPPRNPDVVFYTDQINFENDAHELDIRDSLPAPYSSQDTSTIAFPDSACLEQIMVKISTKIYVPVTGSYQFIFNADNAAKLYIDNSLLLYDSFDSIYICDIGDHYSPPSDTIILTAGYHDLYLELAQSEGDYACVLYWKKTNQTEYKIFSSRDFSYYSNNEYDPNPNDCHITGMNNAPTFTLNWSDYRTKCKEELVDAAIINGTKAWKDSVARYTSKFLNKHYNACFNNPLNETFGYSYKANEYHYTLYYYDQAGNLVQTVPPQGIDSVRSTAFVNGLILPGNEPQHRLITRYKYNSLNQLTYQCTPDGGETYFFYDSKGELRLSQNARQKAQSAGNINWYSYTRYDNLGRIVEVGEYQNYLRDLTYMNNKAYRKAILATLDDASFPNNQASPNVAEVTRTLYDVGISGQENLKGRVASISITNAVNGATPDAQSIYSYDPHGNVKKLTSKITGFDDKTVDYDYDLISGKVNKVYFQKGKSDRFFHKYDYDADNRISAVYTSPDSITWEEDARYYYYKHGPLSRMEIGKDKVQGLDYYYTLQGWLKGVNTPNPRRTNTSGNLVVSTDPGLDGIKTSSPTGGNEWANRYIAQDEFAYGLSYYQNDYSPIGTASIGVLGGVYSSPLQNGINAHGLFNGNISAMVTQVHSLANLTANADDNFGMRASAYHYDQLNRITQARSYPMASSGGQWVNRSNTLNSQAFDASYSYDGNGNIITAKVNGPSTTLMDNLSYNYNYSAGLLQNNKLTSVTDPLGNVTGKDLPNQVAGNYQYDPIGNLVKDTSEEISQIKWTVYGKVKEIIRTSGSQKPNLSFVYDAAGNRITKIEKPYNALNTPASWNYTYYSRDASGNVMATYALSTGSNRMEYPVYGSSRVGLYSKAYTTSVLAPVSLSSRYPLSKTYEMSNHLGNVYITLTGLKLGQDTTADSKADYYTVVVQEASDYYPFGMAIGTRSKSVAGGYRYGFNGKEHDGEFHDNYDFGERIYDARIAKFLSVDPLTHVMPAWSPYSFCFNNPISFTDPTGAIPYPITIRAFAPFKSFGFGFHGDDRQYSNTPSYAKNDQGPSARLHQRILFDTDKTTMTTYGWSSPTYKIGSPGDAERATPEISFTSGLKITTASDAQSFQFGTHAAAANPKTPPGTPNIDVFSDFKITENKKAGTLSISGKLTGDNFPSTEAFISDPIGQNVFIGVGQINADVDKDYGPFFELPGKNARNIASFNFTINTDEKGNFIGVTSGNKSYSIEAWNKQFLNTKPKKQK